MTWFPIGPDFVYAPRDATAPLRLSRRNEAGRQAMVSAIAVDPSNPSILYVVVTPVGGGSGVFRSADGGLSWTSISDALQVADANFTPTCIAVHPVNGGYLYLGTDAGNVYVSPGTSGTSWNAPQSLSTKQVAQIIVDPRNANNPLTTVVYAGTHAGGVFRSTNGGGTWGPALLPGWVASMAFSMPQAGTAHFYAAVMSEGIYHTTDPTTAWNPVSGTLPAAGSFQDVRLAMSPGNPSRIYALFDTEVLYATASGPTGWGQVATPPPAEALGTYSFALAIPPNSPANGPDILFYAAVKLWRSIDSGQSWQQWGDNLHDDQHAFAFAPVNPPAGTIPTTLIGCDGGLGLSTTIADPTFNFAAAPSGFNDGATYTASSGVVQNANHGRLTCALIAYHADPSVAAVGYIGCQDTGISGHTTALGWRGLADADCWAILSSPGSGGVNVWARMGYPYLMRMPIDVGNFSPSELLVALPGNVRINSTSNHALTVDHKCIAGARPVTFSNAPINAGPQTVTPGTMTNIAVGTKIEVDLQPNEETVTVTAVTGTTFTATFAQAHPAGQVWLEVLAANAVIVDQGGNATQVSQVLGNDLFTGPSSMAASPSDATLFCCGTGDNRVFATQGVAVGPGTVWKEAAVNKPASPSVSAVAIDPAGNVYVLLSSVPGASTTPLYSIGVAAGTWTAQPSAALPAGPFGQLVADPVQPNTLYASAANGVYRLTLNAGTWTWTALTPGLPGTAIQDLWIGNIGTVAAPKVLLRAAVAARGVYETDVTAAAVDPPARPYVRDHFLDTGWLLPSPEYLTNPFRPQDGPSVFHYQCADIKVDAQNPGPPAFFQTDPEGTTPLSHVQFDQLRDDSQMLPGADAAKVHIQVHNRSGTPLDSVSVWAVYANASGGVPLLNKSAMNLNNFDFWSQFPANGNIAPNLPADSPWTAVGAPQVLNGIDVAHPQVASWDWTVPSIAVGSPGHYCMVVFVHSQLNKIGETTDYSVDSVTLANPQIGQRNMHILAVRQRGGRASAYIEFNGLQRERELDVVDLHFDLRPLPEQLQVHVRFSELQTVAPLAESLTGLEPVHVPHGGEDHDKDDVAHHHDHDDDDDRREKRRHRPHIVLAPSVYRATPAALAAVRGVRLPAHAAVAALLELENTGELPPGEEYRFQVQQVVHGKVIGGSTYIVKVAGKPKLPPPIEAG